MNRKERYWNTRLSKDDIAFQLSIYHKENWKKAGYKEPLNYADAKKIKKSELIRVFSID